MELINKLINFELFKEINKYDLEKLIEISSIHKYKDQSIIIAENSIDFDLYTILNGKVEVSITDSASNNGNQRIVATLSTGEQFGEITFLEGVSRSAQVTAIGDMHVIQFDGGKLHELLHSNYRFGFVFMKNLASALAVKMRRANSN